MGISILTGNGSESKTVKNKGVVCSSCFTQEGTDVVAEHHGCRGLPDIEFTAGRTVELKRFEFCRMRFGIGASVPSGVDKEDVQWAASRFILEWIKKEESVLAKEEYEMQIEDAALKLLSICPCRKINVAYGLTLKSGKSEYESEQVDVSEYIPINDGADLMEEFTKLSDKMARYVDSHHRRIKGLGDSAGL